jgi:hypothetical protein
MDLPTVTLFHSSPMCVCLTNNVVYLFCINSINLISLLALHFSGPLSIYFRPKSLPQSYIPKNFQSLILENLNLWGLLLLSQTTLKKTLQELICSKGKHEILRKKRL